MRNFPIHTKQYKLSQEEVLLYIASFSNHTVKILSIEERVLFSEHRYSDGLRFKVQWIIGFSIPENHSDITIEKLLHYYEQEWVTPVFCRILSHSKRKKKPRTPEVSIRDKFVQEVLKQDVRRLTDIEYKEIEFWTNEKTSLPDEYFEELQTFIENNMLFEQYCNKKEAQSR